MSGLSAVFSAVPNRALHLFNRSVSKPEGSACKPGATTLTTGTPRPGSVRSTTCADMLSAERRSTIRLVDAASSSGRLQDVPLQEPVTVERFHARRQYQDPLLLPALMFAQGGLAPAIALEPDEGFCGLADAPPKGPVGIRIGGACRERPTGLPSRRRPEFRGEECKARRSCRPILKTSSILCAMRFRASRSSSGSAIWPRKRVRPERASRDVSRAADSYETGDPRVS